MQIQAKKRVRAGCLVTCVLALLATPVAADAATRTVSTTGSDTDDCATTACRTIQYAVDQAVAGDTIDVAAGDYSGGVLINKSLTFEGAQADQDARGRTGASESNVVANGALAGFRVTDPVAVDVDGFSFTGHANYGLTLSGATSGYDIRNNIFDGNVNGLLLQSDGAQQTTVSQNSFRDNRDDGIFSGNPTGTSNALIADNDFSGHDVGAIVLAGGGDDVDIRGNKLTDDSSIAAFDTSDLAITANTSANPTGSSVYIGGGNDGVDVSQNTLTGNSTRPAVLIDNSLGYGANSGVQVTSNQLSGNAIGIQQVNGASTDVPVARNNTVTGNQQGAVNADPSVAIDARCNWWGAVSGPSGSGPGSGDSVSAGVTFQPWLTAPPASACDGPLAPPPAPPAPPATAPPNPEVPTGTPGADNITGSPGNDRIAAGGGSDKVNGGAGGDYLLGEAGNDRLFGAEGNDSLNGGSGNDRMAGGEGNDRLNGDTGNDLFFGGTGNDRMTGGSGNDRLFGDTGNDRFSGGSGNDNFSGGAGDDVIDGGAGDDLLSGNGGQDTIRGGSGDDRIKVRGGGRDTVSCGPGEDSVSADRSDRVSRDCERVRRG